MNPILKPFKALYAAMFILSASLGLLATFLSLRLKFEGCSTLTTGMILTSYFIGCVFGSLYSNRLIKTVGHIRSFAAFAALFTAMIMLHGCFFSAPAWAIFRFLSGIAAMGLFTVIESWLNECTQPQSRGKVFSFYMIMCYMGAGTGQQLLILGDITEQTLFFVVGFLLVCCIIPVSLTRSINPEIPKIKPKAFKNIIAMAPMGLTGALTAGLLISSFYTMGPIFCHNIGLSVPQVSLFMTLTVLGGLIIQWPIGLLSDRFDRSIVIPVICVLFSIISLLVIWSSKGPFTVLLATTGIFGGFLFCIYPVSVARAHDLFDPSDSVNVSSALLFFYGIGSIGGPLTSSMIMELSTNPLWLYLFFASTGLISALVSIILRQKEIAPIVPVEEQSEFMLMNQHTGQVVMQIDPRTEPE